MAAKFRVGTLLAETLHTLLNMELVAAACIAILSGILHGYTGFGAALFMAPLFTLLFGPREAIVLVAIIASCGSAQLYPGATRNARWRELVPIICAILICTPIGVYLLVTLDSQVIRRIMGAFVLLAALVLLAGWLYRGPRGKVAGALVGGLAGLVNGATGVGGPPLAIYFLSAPIEAEAQRANIVIAVATNVILALVFLAIGGQITTRTLILGMMLVPLYVVGTWFGGRLFAVAPQEYFRRVALILLLTTGAVVLVS